MRISLVDLKLLHLYVVYPRTKQYALNELHTVVLTEKLFGIAKKNLRHGRVTWLQQGWDLLA